MVRLIRMAEPAGTVTDGIESVVIRVPAHKDYIVVVRSALAQLGARLGYTVAEIIDLRLAVDETCCLLIGAGPPDGPSGGDVECRVRVGAGSLQVTVIASAVGVRQPDRDGFGWKVLSALVDTMTWVKDGTTVRVDLVKRHRPQFR